ncbi:MAG: NAD(P)-dependent oxidoreductase [Sediminibacterium sp.]
MIDELQAMGFAVDYRPALKNEDTIFIIAEYSGLIVNTKTKVHKALIDSAVKLDFIGRVGSGMEHIDVAYAKSKGIRVYSSPEGNANAVGEHALGMLLALLNKMANADAQIRNGIWQREKNRGVELAGKTVGIIGYGNTGSAFARKLTALDCRIFVYDKYKSGFGNDIIQEVSLDILKEQSNIISLHLPLNAESKYWLDAKCILEISQPFYLINTARGGVVHTESLLQGLESGKIIGAALDVFENENFNALDSHSESHFRKLATMQNVLMTPHIAGWTVESKWKLAKILTQKIKENEMLEN